MMRLATICVAAMTIGLPGFGQSPMSPGQVQLTRQSIQERRKEIVTQAMTFTAAEEKAFWPLFGDWRAKNMGLGDRRLKLIVQVEDSSRLSDAEMKVLVESALKLEDDALKLKKEYIKKFRKILPERKVARFFQLESKLDAIVNYDLAGRVALAE